MPSAPQKRQGMSFSWVRDRIFVKQALASARFLCEVNPAHAAFIAEASDRNYLEGHHLIPLSCQPPFSISIDVYANLVGLCPNCHRFLRFARRADRRTVLSDLYSARADRLHHGGTDVNHDGFPAAASRQTLRMGHGWRHGQ